MMSIERFEALLDAYGADSRRWPAAERDPGLALVADDVRARALLAEARALDRGLDACPAPQVSPELRARVLASAPAPSRAARWAVAGWARVWTPGAGLVAAGVAGLMFGAALGAGSLGPGSDSGAAQALLADAEPYDELVLAENGSS